MNICNYKGSTDVTDIAKQLRAVSKSVCYLISQGGGGGGGTVTSVSSANADATVAASTTTPVITIVSAPKLSTARTINGTSFDGTANITITAAAGTLTGTTLNSTVVTSSLTGVGTITTGVWNGTAITDTYISSASTWNAKQSAITFGTGVQTALGVNIGSIGAPILFNGAGGTPSSITLTNATGYLGTVNGNTFTSGSSTYTGTAGQTYTFPTTSATIARIDAGNTFVGANNFTNGIAVNTSSTVYRTTNGGANVSGSNNFNDITGSASTAGALGVGTSTTTGLLDFTAANGTRRIARAGIGLTNLVNTAGSESADFIINTQSAGTAASEKLRISSTGDVTVTGGGIIFATVAKGITYKSGTGARAGNATLVAGTVTVTNTTVTANTIVMLTRKTAGGTLGNITYTVSAGASFTINSDNALDTSIISYVLYEVN